MRLPADTMQCNLSCSLSVVRFPSFDFWILKCIRFYGHVVKSNLKYPNLSHQNCSRIRTSMLAANLANSVMVFLLYFVNIGYNVYPRWLYNPGCTLSYAQIRDPSMHIEGLCYLCRYQKQSIWAQLFPQAEVFLQVCLKWKHVRRPVRRSMYASVKYFV